MGLCMSVFAHVWVHIQALCWHVCASILGTKFCVCDLRHILPHFSSKQGKFPATGEAGSGPKAAELVRDKAWGHPDSAGWSPTLQDLANTLSFLVSESHPTDGPDCSTAPADLP